ncbi:Pycsar system effector family protein [Sediminicola luteus]|uniref:Phosphohydrolase n=1 Tax=Sediminicola luteus TaxID=319238 RepID=A0A2A4G597_9FLAO|nr:Pycsar system effector family protein [Sediminicola luteus]PCE63158.1 phosphohydrolase [Sediminicola luteus]
MSELIEKAKQHVTELLTQELDPDFLYHNLRHTQRVVKNTKDLIDHYGLQDKETPFLLAAWFHDTGYLKSKENHEALGCEIAEAYLTAEGLDVDAIARVKKLILATRMDHSPVDFDEELIKDADTSHFGKDNFFETSEILRKELAVLGQADYSKKKWRNLNIKTLKEHTFYTDYAQQVWQPQKEANIRIMEHEKTEKAQRAEKEIAKKEALKAKYKSDSPDRGVQTMYRVTMRNHLKLSDIADSKANILLSVNALIISLVLANMLPKLDNPSNAYLITPTIIYISFALVSMVLSIIATRPNVTQGKFTKKDVADKKVNLLFFGNFHKMPLDDYQWAMNELAQDKEYVYSSLTMDLYFLGKVLDRKYKILRVTYTIFMIGIILSLVSFVVAFQLAGPEANPIVQP